MDKIVWSNDFCLGVEEVDFQHKQLVEIIGRFYDILQGDESEYFSNREVVIKDLVDYTLYHFKTEEKLFKEYNYISTDLHASQHRNFESEVSRQIDNILVADISHAKVFYGFLVTWLLSHIAKADRAFCNVLLEKKQNSLL